jgi:hypothetical protein
MTDERIDALIRELDVQSNPDPDFVRSSYAALRPRARAGRVSDASRIGRLRRDLRLMLAGARWPTTARPVGMVGVVVLLVLLVVATMAALALVGALNQDRLVLNGPSTDPSVAVVSPRAPGWTATGTMITARPGHVAVLLLDGRVLALGGPIETITPSNAAELYDPDTGGWAATGSMLAPRFEFTATVLLDGKILVAGGEGLLTSAELYDPLSGTWTTTGAMATGRYGHSATLLRDGRVLVAGGIVAGDAADDQMPPGELYDPISGTWTVTGAMAADRYGHTATLLPDGKVLVVGGSQDGSPDGPFAELYDPLSGTWTAARNMATMRSSHTATLLPNGTVLVAGGYIRSTRELCGQPAGSPSVDCTNPLASAEVYDPQTGAWSATQNMVEPRGAHTATLLADGRILVAGGSGSAEVNPCQCHAPVGSSELYDPASGTWSATASMVEVRSGHTATLLPDGRVLVASGNGMEIGIGGVMLASAELYDPGSGN